MTSSPGVEQRTDEELNAAIAELEAELAPLTRRAAQIRERIDAIRTELRRRARQATLQSRQAVRVDLASGRLPSLEELVSGAAAGIDPGAELDQLTFRLSSATEVRVGFASASRQSLSFTDGSVAEEAYALDRASQLWAQGWEFGSPQARGVRIYPVGSRAERVVPPGELRVERKV